MALDTDSTNSDPPEPQLRWPGPWTLTHRILALNILTVLLVALLYRRERQEFGGRIQWEAVFFGLLAGIGLAASLTAMVLGGLIAAGASDFSEEASSLVDQIVTGGGAVVVAILAFAYLTGGYVAAKWLVSTVGARAWVSGYSAC